ncbi:penicillin-binding transpeptidase domain-containing protein [Bacillus marinisedimentorum]|uniref:penicillin-binding transpeptidase domain-containing protein n=1 Tax=Bacillus marinisedimentorum TaxID=1821260 RepID=UPI0008733149|nr:penicillin-binding transpeptidase domain-containing protein [Bacillus marinisedimentorum]
MRNRPFFFLFLVLTALSLLALSGCAEKPKPADAFANYVEHWNDKDFNSMYSMLTAETKKRIAKEDFTGRYEKIYEDLDVSNLKVEFDRPEEETEPGEDGTVTFPYRVKMDTIAGPIEFEHEATLRQEEIEEEARWTVKWDTTLIFPELAPGDKVIPVALPPERGDIEDRNGVKLATKGTVLEVGMVPGRMEGQEDQSVKEAAEILGVGEDHIRKQLGLSWVNPESFVPIARIPADETETSKQIQAVKGTMVREVSDRVYPYKEAAAHLTGYTAKVTAEDLEAHPDKSYGPNDMIGRRGLEKVFEEKLRGEAGARINIVSGEGDRTVLAEKPAQHGETIRLAIDISIQEGMYRQLEGEQGAGVAIHPKTGEILAMASAPSYDPNDQLPNRPGDGAGKDELKARFGMRYAPGSTFKPITAAIGLETGAITPETTINVSGKTWKKDSSWGGYHVTRVSDPGGPVDLQKALVMSDNIYFAQAALAIGKEKFMESAKMYGFYENVPFAYPVYQSILAGEEGIKSEVRLADTGYGQGQVETSPVHLAFMYTPFLNKGNLISPQLIMQSAEQGEVWHESVMSEQTADIIRQDLIQVIESPNGTARSVDVPEVKLAGKTGTAELKMSKDEKGQENGWFVAFDAEKGGFLTVMLIEDVKNGEGSHYVLPKVERVIEQHLLNQAQGN